MGESEKIYIEDISKLRAWLKKNHMQKESVWLVTYKKGFGSSYISYDDIVDELMCFGWVDSLPKNLDEEKTMRRISPRNPKSNWSKVNKQRVGRLTKAGKMQEAGLKMVAMAKSNGIWNFLDDVEKLIVPDDLEDAFSRNAQARLHYERFPNSSKRNILEWIKKCPPGIHPAKAYSGDC